LQALGLRGVLLLSKPGKKQNNWVSEVLAPRCQLSETSHTCLERIKAMYDIVIQGKNILLFILKKCPVFDVVTASQVSLWLPSLD